MSETAETPASSMRLAVGAKKATELIARGFSALVTEHSLALLATAKAALPRRRLTDLRVMYTTSRSKNRSRLPTLRETTDMNAPNRPDKRSNAPTDGHDIVITREHHVGAGNVGPRPIGPRLAGSQSIQKVAMQGEALGATSRKP